MHLATNKSSPKVIWEERVALAQLCNKVPIGYNGCPNSTTNLPLPFRRSLTPSNIPLSQPTPFTTQNGIRIQSTVLPQYTFRTHRQTNRQTTLFQERLCCIILIVSDALTIAFNSCNFDFYFTLTTKAIIA